MKNQLSSLVYFLSAHFLALSNSFGQVSEFAELEAEYASQTGTAYTIVFDDSGSMIGQKIREAKQAFAWWLEKAGPNNAWCFLPLNSRYLDVEFVKNGESQVIRAVKNLEAGGITPIVDTLALAYEKIKTRRETVTPYERHLVIILTDGGRNQRPWWQLGSLQIDCGFTGQGYRSLWYRISWRGKLFGWICFTLCSGQ